MWQRVLEPEPGHVTVGSPTIATGKPIALADRTKESKLFAPESALLNQ